MPRIALQLSEAMAWSQVMNLLRDLRRNAGLTEQGFADLIDTPVNTFRMWDSGLRPVPAHVLPRARRATIEHARQTQLLPLSELATELGVHVRTLQAAARTGRLDVHFSEQSVFGRPRKVASRAAAERFIRTHYRRFAGQAPCPAPLPSVPPDYDVRLKILRSEFELSQPALARLIGAAGKAVVYQWESRKRTPSPVFWQRIQELSRNV